MVSTDLQAVHSVQTSESRVQKTLQGEFELSGVGLHTGALTRVRVLPAPPDTGRYFVRVDLPHNARIAAQIESVSQTALSTELTASDAKVRTVEHLLATLAAMGVDNACIEIDGPEVPLLDGSAHPWAEAIDRVGLLPQSATRPIWVLNEPVWVRQDDIFVAALPSPELRFTYGIDFELPAIGNQWHSWAPPAQGTASTSDFQAEIAPARTFGLLHQIEHLRAAGLIKGGSLDNALVCSDTGWVNPPLRFPNEPVRHKLLDLIGDLSLLGTFPIAHFLAYKASHSLHVQLVRQMMS
ncbi:UDP-3-O-[3-hydroxymyristoyl] N-acetylglucosamine deacetylase [Leptolyngbya sp. 'hensonii']|uniref:UDP-3-O-acyl-N-acetylglucosamine deacetylase n=1 Tax=Leptolyngbya sp. 'hensonii' TaxID=1922337 RepID=UPI00094FCD4F|nr:UDP-3-O-acyl-N-acetylglucosamine deacetylase [Leptolyngbya sp. 'hensonii']OLP17862.1 UDP-3-O-[3-hydroxymyristoyl] N-acetylglucosamine deacetylase [Leptolyngbya sp. 'hensonii']